MYGSEIKRLQSKTEEKRVRITEVNPSIRMIRARDVRGVLLDVAFDFLGSIVEMPQVDDVWVIQRSNNLWRLVRKQEQNSSYPVEGLMPGDKKVEATNDLYLSGTNVLIDGKLTIVNNVPYFVDLTISNDVLISDQTETSVPWDTVIYDGRSMWSSLTPTRVNILVDGVYAILSTLTYLNVGIGSAYNSILINNEYVTNPWVLLPTYDAPTITSQKTVHLIKGDYIEISAWQDSGDAINIFGLTAPLGYNSSLSVTKVG